MVEYHRLSVDKTDQRLPIIKQIDGNRLFIIGDTHRCLERAYFKILFNNLNVLKQYLVNRLCNFSFIGGGGAVNSYSSTFCTE